jgi:hypothetical protein
MNNQNHTPVPEDAKTERDLAEEMSLNIGVMKSLLMVLMDCLQEGETKQLELEHMLLAASRYADDVSLINARLIRRQLDALRTEREANNG